MTVEFIGANSPPKPPEHYLLQSLWVKIVPFHDRYMPQYKTEGAACADACAFLDSRYVLKPKERIKIPLGFKIQLPPGWELQVRGRSGLADNHGIMVTNGIGTIDSDYRGWVTILLYNSSDKPFPIEDGDRIAQVCVQPTTRILWDRTTELDTTERGEGGFGSTGSK